MSTDPAGQGPQGETAVSDGVRNMPAPGWVSMAGDPEVYSDPRCYRPETRPGALQSPSFEDARGRIDRLESGGVGLNLIYSRAGVLRSGDLHPVAQHDVLVSGRAELRTRGAGGEERTDTVSAGQHLVLLPHVPHIFTFTEDTVMVEWWEGDFEAWFWRPWRELVENPR